MTKFKLEAESALSLKNQIEGLKYPVEGQTNSELCKGLKKVAETLSSQEVSSPSMSNEQQSLILLGAILSARDYVTFVEYGKPSVWNPTTMLRPGGLLGVVGITGSRLYGELTALPLIQALKEDGKSEDSISAKLFAKRAFWDWYQQTAYLISVNDDGERVPALRESAPFTGELKEGFEKQFEEITTLPQVEPSCFAKIREAEGLVSAAGYHPLPEAQSQTKETAEAKSSGWRIPGVSLVTGAASYFWSTAPKAEDNADKKEADVKVQPVSQAKPVAESKTAAEEKDMETETVDENATGMRPAV
jgi:hypothetical protein